MYGLPCLGHVRENDSDRPERTIGGGTPTEGCDKTEVRKVLKNLQFFVTNRFRVS